MKAQTLDRVVNTINKNIDDSLKLIKQHKDADYFWGVNNRDELDGGIVKDKRIVEVQNDVAKEVQLI